MLLSQIKNIFAVLYERLTPLTNIYKLIVFKINFKIINTSLAIFASVYT